MGPAPREPVPLTQSLDGVVRSLQGTRGGPTSGAKAVGGVFGQWVEIVGEHVAAHVTPVRLDRDRLVVEVADPAWATQVRLLSDRMRERVAEVTGTHVGTVEVRVAGARRRSRDKFRNG
jgi:predicted nucleic acid-binding Zn ribbon protein